MKILTVIPARSGSKGIPGKNTILINGKPLIQYTIEAALNSSYLTDVIVSTDSKQIASLSENLGAKVPFIRPKELSTDEAQSAPVILHALNFMESSNGKNYDAVLMLQPTSPFRTHLHINQSIELLKTSQECDSVVSVVSVGGNHPLRMKRMVGSRLVNYVDQGSWDMRPRQVLPDVFIRNGAIYLINRDKLVKDEELIGKHCLGMVMTTKESVNIDTSFDLELTKIIMQDYESSQNKTLKND